LSDKEEFDKIFDVGSNWDNILKNMKEEYYVNYLGEVNQELGNKKDGDV